ncbi:TraR/DksA family transcriptional regulator [Shewanella gelidii]|uniref:Conjugal transfer protein TraR n=1 Tax=Shewanella gelidii TaxID=1642821 RepID=A0A917N9S2_9GAMM|nr:TraR/DksA C4-type zinc finger protein [Shewanella gelidii]MCL1097515.1 TraR/DksA C4-type zinc finger protein [Shewanella gelidii]GGI75853.1 conjugal transfer protein TraR [Shewanella gelidii]
MSRSHIRLELAEQETILRKEVNALSQSKSLSINVGESSLSDLIDAFTAHKLNAHPLFHRLMKLDAANCQLDLGLYGLCADCEAEIDLRRLQADPTEQRCSTCAEQYKHEHGVELRLNH